jgi:hypothetical protein
MSQYIRNLDDKSVMYGFDAPTGGYYIAIFNKEDEVLFEEDGLILSKLIYRLNQNGVSQYNVRTMINDFYEADYPSPLQIFIMRTYGKNVKDLLKNCEIDIKLQLNNFAN